MGVSVKKATTYHLTITCHIPPPRGEVEPQALAVPAIRPPIQAILIANLILFGKDLLRTGIGL